MAEPAQRPRPEPHPSDEAHLKRGRPQTEPERQPARPDEDLRGRIDKLLDAANSASTHSNHVYVTFLLFGLYLVIIFGSTTHEQLLRESPVTLPLLNVGLPLVGFYWVAPPCSYFCIWTCSCS